MPAAGRVRKEYLAVVRGTPAPTRGAIALPLGRSPEDRRRVVVTPAGQHCHTAYEVLSTSNGRALVRCELLTGRTHQIRVHLACAGVADRRRSCLRRAGSGVAAPGASRVAAEPAASRHRKMLVNSRPRSHQDLREVVAESLVPAELAKRKDCRATIGHRLRLRAAAADSPTVERCNSGRCTNYGCSEETFARAVAVYFVLLLSIPAAAQPQTAAADHRQFRNRQRAATIGVLSRRPRVCRPRRFGVKTVIDLQEDGSRLAAGARAARRHEVRAHSHEYARGAYRPIRSRSS